MKILFAIVAALSLASCASVTRGWNEEIAFRSTPPGAIAEVVFTRQRTEIDPGEPVLKTCTTPCSFSALRNEDVAVTFHLAGYESMSVALKRELAGDGAVGVAGNVLIGGSFGALVDVGSGAAMDHKPNPVDVVLVPLAHPERRPTKKR